MDMLIASLLGDGGWYGQVGCIAEHGWWQVMARRGIFVELLLDQVALNAKEQQRSARTAQREHKAAERKAEQARKAEERANAAKLARANKTEKKRLAKEAIAAHVAAMVAQADEKNSELARTYDEIDGLLAATLEVDDYFDLEDLKVTAPYPPFECADLETPIVPPAALSDPPEPVFEVLRTPTGLRAVFGKKKHAAALQEFDVARSQAIDKWNAERAETGTKSAAAAKLYKHAEAQRLEELESARKRHAIQRAEHEAKSAEHNKAIDQLIANLGYGAVDAVQEYVSIVLASSAYPTHFQVSHDFSFEAASAELQLRVCVPDPQAMPAIKQYKYNKSSDEITATSLSQKAAKDRYASAVNQIALRSLHEVFEADRRGLVKTIALEVGSETIDPATGKKTFILFVAVGAERDSFHDLELSSVVPAATLVHLGAAVSKNPFGLVAVKAKGVRCA